MLAVMVICELSAVSTVVAIETLTFPPAPLHVSEASMYELS